MYEEKLSRRMLPARKVNEWDMSMSMSVLPFFIEARYETSLCIQRCLGVRGR